VLEEASREALATTVQKDDERDGAQPLVRFLSFPSGFQRRASREAALGVAKVAVD